MEEYCWEITQVAGCSHYTRSGSSVLEFGFQLDPVVCTHTSDRTDIKSHLRYNIRDVTTASVGECLDSENKLPSDTFSTTNPTWALLGYTLRTVSKNKAKGSSRKIFGV